MAENPLWAFSVAHYAQRDVRQQLLDLQDTHGANVNVVLWAHWLTHKGVLASQALITTLIARIAPLQESWVQPLRSLRRKASLELPQLKPALLEAELAAERIVVDELYRFTLSHSNFGAEARSASIEPEANVCAYLALIAPKHEWQQKIVPLLTALAAVHYAD